MHKNRSIEQNRELGNVPIYIRGQLIYKEMVRQHHWFNGHEFEQTSGDSGGQQERWCPAVRGVANSWTQLSDWTTTTIYKEGVKNIVGKGHTLQ